MKMREHLKLLEKWNVRVSKRMIRSYSGIHNRCPNNQPTRGKVRELKNLVRRERGFFNMAPHILRRSRRRERLAGQAEIAAQLAERESYEFYVNIPLGLPEPMPLTHRMDLVRFMKTSERARWIYTHEGD